MARLTKDSPASGASSFTLMRLAAAVAALLAAFQFRWGDAMRLSFINDDFMFLDKTRAASLPSLWGFDRLAFHWWRPWSRETHYWAVQRLAGADPAVFHAVNAALWISILAAYWALVRRSAGAAAAGWALAAAAAMAAWGLPLLWVAGVQDLWMLLASLLALHAWASDRRGLAALAYAVALLSKETAALLPAVLFAWDMLVAQRRPREAMLRLLPLAVVAVVWAGLHPRLGGQFWQHVRLEHTADTSRLPPLGALGRALLVPFNLDLWPGDGMTWKRGLGTGIAVAGPLLALFWFLRPPGSPSPDASRAHAHLRLGGVWALVGFAPLLLPGLGFHAYYTLLGSLGILFACAPFLCRNQWLASVSIAVLAVLGGVRDHAPTLDWGDAPYQRRAGALLESMRVDLLAKLPRPLPHTRLFFVRVPDRVGFLAADAPALRVWYADSTVSGGYYSAYAPRAAGTPAGEDRFFRLDSLAGWIPVTAGAEEVPSALAANPRWELDHLALGQAFAAAGDWRAAATEYEKLARAFPANAGHAFDAAASWSEAGDSAAAYFWVVEAARRPGATHEMRAAAAARK